MEECMEKSFTGLEEVYQARYISESEGGSR
jgi:hypothetical protein